METQTRKLMQEKISQLFCAVNEKNITADSLMQEIQPLLQDYFMGEFICEGKDIKATFLNGQRFVFSVTSV